MKIFSGWTGLIIVVIAGIIGQIMENDTLRKIFWSIAGIAAILTSWNEIKR